MKTYKVLFDGKYSFKEYLCLYQVTPYRNHISANSEINQFIYTYKYTAAVYVMCCTQNKSQFVHGPYISFEKFMNSKSKGELAVCISNFRLN